jgi:hypothetical protein
MKAQLHMDKCKFTGVTLTKLIPDTHNRAKEIIQDFMIATNGVLSIGRIVRISKRWTE